jgi:hypothetical protein
MNPAQIILPYSTIESTRNILNPPFLSFLERFFLTNEQWAMASFKVGSGAKEKWATVEIQQESSMQSWHRCFCWHSPR